LVFFGQNFLKEKEDLRDLIFRVYFLCSLISSLLLILARAVLSFSWVFMCSVMSFSVKGAFLVQLHTGQTNSFVTGLLMSSP
jgi:hypothetical protein